MSTQARVLVALLCVAGVPAAFAQGVGLRSTNQFPGLVDQNPDHVTITNIGTDALSISYFDDAWKPLQVSSGESVALKSQGNGLSVAFNDGAVTKSIVLRAGVNYAIYWNSGSGRWSIAPYDEVARRPTGLRSR